MSKNILTVFLIVGIAQTITCDKSSTEQCIINQPHITFGEKFATNNYQKSDHVYTIGVVSKGDCPDTSTSPPIITLHKIIPKNEVKEDDILEVKPTHVKPYQTKYTLEGTFTNYQRTAYFFYITESQIKKYPYWTVKNILKGTKAIQQSTKDFLYGPYTFPSNYAEKNRNIKVALVADMDITERAFPTIDELKSDNTNGFDMFLIPGDVAYDIDQEHGQKGDDFFEAMSPISTKLPFLPIAGNHEYRDKSGMFNFRFRQPGTDIGKLRRNSWFSFDYKNIHFVTIDFDHIYR